MIYFNDKSGSINYSIITNISKPRAATVETLHYQPLRSRCCKAMSAFFLSRFTPPFIRRDSCKRSAPPNAQALPDQNGINYYFHPHHPVIPFLIPFIIVIIVISNCGDAFSPCSNTLSFSFLHIVWSKESIRLLTFYYLTKVFCLSTHVL